MKPFDNVAVSATKPRSKVWIKHKYVKYNGAWQNITYGLSLIHISEPTRP